MKIVIVAIAVPASHAEDVRRALWQDIEGFADGIGSPDNTAALYSRIVDPTQDDLSLLRERLGPEDDEEEPPALKIKSFSSPSSRMPPRDQ